MIKISTVPVCGARSMEIQPKFSVLCTEKPNHEGEHRVIYSVQDRPREFSLHGGNAEILGVEYSWPQG